MYLATLTENLNIELRYFRPRNAIPRGVPVEFHGGFKARACAAPVICHTHIAAAMSVAALEAGLDDRVLGTAAPARGEEAVNRNHNRRVRRGEGSNVAPRVVENYSAAAHFRAVMV